MPMQNALSDSKQAIATPHEAVRNHNGPTVPLVSLGLPVFNGECYLAAAIESVLAQTFADFELIITDNASTDQTPAIARRFAERDTRVRYHRHERNLGAAANFNSAFALARGAYFKWCAHDDLIAPAFLEHCLEVMARPQAKDAVLVMPQRRFIDGDGRIITTDPGWEHAMSKPRTSYHRLTFAQLLRCGGEAPPLAFALMRTAALRRTRLIGSYFGGDMVMLTELRLLGEFWEVPEPLFFNRVGFTSPERAMRGNIGGWSAWFDGQGDIRRMPPSLRLILEHVAAIGRAKLPPLKKLACLSAMGGYVGSRLGRMIHSRKKTWRRLREELNALTHSPSVDASPP